MWKRKFEMKQIDLLLVVSIVTTAIFFLINLITWGKSLDASTLGSGKQFCDYFYHTAFASAKENIYKESVDACFPPLSYCMYYLLWRTAPYQDSESVLNWRNYMTANNALLVFVMYSITMMLLINWCISQYYQKTETKYTLLMPVAIAFSYPLLCTSIQRGNAALPVAIMLSIAWLWMDSESKIKQEAAMILIAVSAGFKIYPAILGLEYIRRKDWKRAVRLMIYGILLFFGPFLFFGGIEGFKNLFNILMTHAAYNAEYHYGSIRGITEMILNKFALQGESFQMTGFVTENIFLLGSLACFCISKRKWHRALFISGILASYLGYNWAYTIVYYLPVLFIYLQENGEKVLCGKQKESIWSVINTVGFALIFSIPWFFEFLLEGGIYEGIFIISYVILLVNACSVIREFRLEKLNHLNSQGDSHDNERTA